MVYLLLNCDEYLIGEYIAKLKAALGEAEMADLNTTEFRGNEASAANILGQASMMPFLAPRRLLLSYGYLEQLDKRMAASKKPGSAAYTEATQLLEGVAHTPDTCDVVLIDETIDKRRHLWKGFTLPKTAKDSGRKVLGLADLIKAGQITAETLATPDPRSLGGWIQQRAQTKQIAIDGRAIRMLADFVGPNLRLLDNELDKLAAYASGRSIMAEDVKLLVSDASEALIWNLTDSLSQRNGRNAMRSLYELRRGEVNAFYLLTMMARQYRILIKVKEAQSIGGGGNEYDIAKVVGESPYPVKKAMQQLRQYTSEELDGIMERLLEADFAMKTGTDPETEIDVLVAELTQRKRS